MTAEWKRCVSLSWPLWRHKRVTPGELGFKGGRSRRERERVCVCVCASLCVGPINSSLIALRQNPKPKRLHGQTDVHHTEELISEEGLSKDKLLHGAQNHNSDIWISPHVVADIWYHQRGLKVDLGHPHFGYSLKLWTPTPSLITLLLQTLCSECFLAQTAHLHVCVGLRVSLSPRPASSSEVNTDAITDRWGDLDLFRNQRAARFASYSPRKSFGLRLTDVLRPAGAQMSSLCRFFLRLFFLRCPFTRQPTITSCMYWWRQHRAPRARYGIEERLSNGAFEACRKFDNDEMVRKLSSLKMHC